MTAWRLRSIISLANSIITSGSDSQASKKVSRGTATISESRSATTSPEWGALAINDISPAGSPGRITPSR